MNDVNKEPDSVIDWLFLFFSFFFFLSLYGVCCTGVNGFIGIFFFLFFFVFLFFFFFSHYLFLRNFFWTIYQDLFSDFLHGSLRKIYQIQGDFCFHYVVLQAELSKWRRDGADDSSPSLAV